MTELVMVGSQDPWHLDSARNSLIRAHGGHMHEGRNHVGSNDHRRSAGVVLVALVVALISVLGIAPGAGPMTSAAAAGGSDAQAMWTAAQADSDVIEVGPDGVGRVVELRSQMRACVGVGQAVWQGVPATGSGSGQVAQCVSKNGGPFRLEWTSATFAVAADQLTTTTRPSGFTLSVVHRPLYRSKPGSVDPNSPIVAQWNGTEAVSMEVRTDGTLVTLEDSSCQFPKGNVVGFGLTRTGERTWTGYMLGCNLISGRVSPGQPTTFTVSGDGTTLVTTTPAFVSPNETYRLRDREATGVVDGCDTVRCWGWARDPDHNGPIDVHLYLNGPSGTGTFITATSANQPSEAAIGGTRAHRFSVAHNQPAAPTTRSVHAHAIGRTPTGALSQRNPLLAGSPRSIAADQAATGVLDGCDSVRCWGWARDPDHNGPVDVHLYLNGPAGTGTHLTTTTANQPSEAAIGGTRAHRFSVAHNLPAAPTTRTIHAHAIGRTPTGATSNLNPALSGPAAVSGWYQCPNGHLSVAAADLAIAQMTQLQATEEQVAQARLNPCDPRIPSEAALTKSDTYDVAFSLERPSSAPGRGLEDFTRSLNTPARIPPYVPVVNYHTWTPAFLDVEPFPFKFRDQVLAAVPPAGSRQTSPFRYIHFNLTGLGNTDNAIRNGSLGFGAPGVGVTNWELYNVIGSARDKTHCYHWYDAPHLLQATGIQGIYLIVRCPGLPPGVPPPGLDGSARRL